MREVWIVPALVGKLVVFFLCTGAFILTVFHLTVEDLKVMAGKIGRFWGGGGVREVRSTCDGRQLIEKE